MKLPSLLASLALSYILVLSVSEAYTRLDAYSFDSSFYYDKLYSWVQEPSPHTFAFDSDDASEVIQITVTASDLPPRDSFGRCNFMVTFREQYSQTSEPLITVCGDELPTFVSSSSVLYMTYETDGSTVPGRYSGIRLNYKTLERMEEEVSYSFGDTYSTTSLGGYGRDAKTNEDPDTEAKMRTQVRLTASSSSGNEVQIDVTYSDMPPPEMDGTCQVASLTFYDGPSTNSPVIATVCGTQTPSFSSSGGIVLVVLEASPYLSKRYDGVVFRYESDLDLYDNDLYDNVGIIVGACVGSGVLVLIVLVFVVHRVRMSRQPGIVTSYATPVQTATPAYVINHGAAPYSPPTPQQQQQQQQQLQAQQGLPPAYHEVAAGGVGKM